MRLRQLRRRARREFLRATGERLAGMTALSAETAADPAPIWLAPFDDAYEAVLLDIHHPALSVRGCS